MMAKIFKPGRKHRREAVDFLHQLADNFWKGKIETVIVNKEAMKDENGLPTWDRVRVTVEWVEETDGGEDLTS